MKSQNDPSKTRHPVIGQGSPLSCGLRIFLALFLLVGTAIPSMAIVRFAEPTYTVDENGIQAHITVISSASGEVGTVKYVSDTTGTAIPNVDYVPVDNILYFDGTGNQKEFTVDIIDNSIQNPNKTINLVLMDPTGDITLDEDGTNAVLTIRDDETVQTVPNAGQFQFSSSFYTVTENETTPSFFGPLVGEWRVTSRSAKGALITVTRTGSSTGRVMVDFSTVPNVGPLVANALPGYDYTPTNGTLVFDQYQMSANFIVPIASDGISNNNKTVFIELSNVRAYTNGLQKPIYYNPSPFKALDEDEDASFIIPKLGNVTNAAIRILEVNHGDYFSIERASYRIDEIGAGDRPNNPAYITNIVVDVIFPKGGPATVYARVLRGLTHNYTLTAGSDYAVGDTRSPGNPVYTDGQQNVSYGPDYEPSENAAGNNYVAVQFPTGWTRQKIVIPIINDEQVEFNEDIYVELDPENSPRPSGGKVGRNGFALVTILHDDEPAGALDREWNPDDVPRSVPNEATPFNLTPGANNTVHSVAVQADGKSIIGGDFTSVNTFGRNGVARFNLNGSLDSTFNPGSGADGLVEVVLVQPDQKILVAGGFASMDNTARIGIARLNPDGSLDYTFNPGNGADGRIRAMVLQADGKILIAGDFTVFNDANRNGLARLNADGSLDSSFDPLGGATGTIWSLALGNQFSDQSIYIGGDFTSYQGHFCNRIARLNADGSFDATFNTGRGANNFVYAIAVQPDNRILLGGAFNTIDVYDRSGVARLNVNGTVDTSYTPGSGFNDSVYTIKIQPDGKAIYGGVFTLFNETRRIGLARLKLNGTLDTTFMDTAYNQFAGVITRAFYERPNFINSIALQDDGNLLVGGSFHEMGGNPSRSAGLRTHYNQVSRNDIRTRMNVARLIGGVTPGPGNLEFTALPYRTDENASAMSATLRRIDGLLGTSKASVSTTNRIATAGLDYTATTANVSWNEYVSETFRAPGAVGLKYVSIPILDDKLIEGDETINIGLTQPTGSVTLGGEFIPIGTALGVAQADITIVDNDFAYGIFNFGAAGFSTNENAGKATITIIRTNGSSGQVTVDYFTRSGRTNGPPENGFNEPTPFALSSGPEADYVPTSGKLTFAPGETSKTFNITLLNNVGVERDEFVTLILTNATGGAKLPGGAMTSAVTNSLMIIDDDFAAGHIQFGSTNGAVNGPVSYTGREDSGLVTISVVRIGGSIGAASVQYQTADGTATLVDNDYTSTNGILTWGDGDSSTKTFKVRVNGPDQKIEGTETVGLILSNPLVNGNATPDLLGNVPSSTLYIEDADSLGTLSFSQSAYDVDENGGFASITVVRRGGIAGSLSVDYQTAPGGSATPGTNYGVTSGTFNFVPGQTATNFIVVINDNNDQDGNKTVKLSLSNANPPSGLGAIVNAELTIIDNESFSIPAGTLDSTFDQNTSADNAVQAIALQTNGNFLIAGDFTTVDDVFRTRIARLNLDGTLDASFNAGTGPNDSVRSMLLQPDGKVLVGGLFTVINSTNRNGIARLNIDGTVDAFFNPGAGANNPVYALALQSDLKVLVGGAFNVFNAANHSGVSRVNTNGSVDATFNPGIGADGVVYALAVQPDGKILVGGAFSNFNGVAHTSIVRLNPNGSVDPSFPNLALNGAVKAIFIQPDSKIVLGGSFTTNFNGISRNYVARFSADGALDTTFLANGGGANNSVYTIAQQLDGKLVLGGDFTTFNGVTRNRLVRLINDGISDGKTDPTINFGTGANGYVTALAIQPDRKILFGGGFTSYNEKQRKYIARIHGGSISGAGNIEFVAPTFNASENNSNVLITVRRNGGTTGSVTATVTTSNGTGVAGTDYGFTSTNLVFPEGETLASFFVPVYRHSNYYSDATAVLTLSGYTGGATNGPQSTATLTVRNEESVIAFSKANYSANENEVSGNATISLVRAGATNTTATVSYATVTGGTSTINTDYSSTSGSVTFVPGETTKNFNVHIIDDLEIEGNETVNLVLSGPSPVLDVNLGLSTATLLIVDNDFGPGKISFSSSTYSTSESTAARVTVVRTGGSSGIVSVRYKTSNGTALAVSDYTPLNDILSFADGEIQKVITIPIVNDLPPAELDETFSIALSEPTGGVILGDIINATVTILDDDAYIVPAGSALVSESVTPTNNVIDPDENVRLLLGLRNIGGTDTANIVATLQTNINIIPLGTQTQNYGVLTTTNGVGRGNAANRPFNFKAVGTNGTRISVVLSLVEVGGTTNFLGTVTYNYVIGEPAIVFANTNLIVITDNAPASPYPSVINVSGVVGPLTRISVTLSNISHNYPDDVNVLLVGPNGQNVLLMGNTGGNVPLVSPTITFVDVLTNSLPDSGAITNGSYNPTHFGFTTFLPEAPQPPYGNSLDVFKGASPNGAWKLYVMDDLSQDSGLISGGWSLKLLSVDSLSPVVDVSLNAAATPAVYPGSQLTYAIAVTNNGPASASNLRLTNTFTSDVTLKTPSVATQLNARTIVANLGSRTNGGYTNFSFTVTTQTLGVFTNTVSITATETESNTANNKVVIVRTVSEIPSMQSSYSGGNVMVAWPATDSSFILQTATNLPSSSWITVTNAPVEVSGQKIVTIPVSTNGIQFYRLILP